MNDTVAEAIEPPVETAGAPWHLWGVGVVSLLWNCIGAYDYSMSQLRGADYMQSMGMGSDAIAYMAAFPAWATGAWALGVWGSFAGSILLLLRSRHAVWAFVVSLAGVLGMTLYTSMHAGPASMASPGATVFDWIIKLVVLLLLGYAWTLSRRGVLR